MQNPNTLWKPLIVVGLVLGVTLAISTRDASAQGQFGILGGLNIANMGGDADLFGDELANEIENLTEYHWTSAKTSTNGIGLGAYYVIPTSQNVGVQIEGEYIQRGVSYDLSGGGITAETTLKMDYIEFPLLLRFSLPSQGSVHTHFVVGPAIGFKSSAEVEVNVGGNSQSVGMDEGFESIVFGATAGLGVAFDAGTNTTVMFHARYHLGLSNAAKTGPGEDFSITASDISLFAGLEFAVGQ